MENGIERRVCVDTLETVSLRLGKLSNMINSLCLGMQHENLEQQSVDCVESIAYCVNDIRYIAVDCLQQIQKLQNNMDENNKHE